MRRTCLIAAALVLLLAGLAPSYAGRGQRPDLVVGTGSLARAGAAVEVSATIANTGGRRAVGSRAAVLVDGTQRAVVAVGKVRRGGTRTISTQVPLGVGSHTISVCADAGTRVRERRERNNCRTLGSVEVPAATAVSSTPTQPLAYRADTPVRLDAAGAYWLRVPAAYDASHRTPAPLLVFLHGCYDQASNQMASLVRAADLSRAIVMVPELGRDGACWDLSADPARLRAAIADLRTRLNVDPARIVLGGYSSGALLAGRTALTEGPSYAGLLVMMGSAFYGDRASLLAGATARFPVAWRSHTGDTTFPVEGVRADQRAMADAGFAVTVSETGGTHTYTDADLAWLVSRSPTWPRAAARRAPRT